MRYSIDGRVVPTLNYNPYHNPENGQFASKGGSNGRRLKIAKITQRGGISSDSSLIEAIDSLNDSLLREVVNNPIADLSDRRLKEIRSKRERMYYTEDEFELANQWLMSIIGNSANIMDKARVLNFDPTKEIELSKETLGDKEVKAFRSQEGVFDKEKYSESRWSDIPYAYSTSGNTYSTIVNKKNILIHPEILYSSDLGDKIYLQEREYVVGNKFIGKVKKVKDKKMINSYTTHKNRGKIAGFGTLLNATKQTNAGTAASGWWNPDHAARVALRSPNAKWIDNLNGDGKKYAKAILNNMAVDYAFANYRKDNIDVISSPQVEDTGTSLVKEIKKLAPQEIKNSTFQSKQKMSSDNVAELQSFINNVDTVVDALADYAVSDNSDDYKAYSLTRIDRNLNALKFMVKRNKTLLNNTSYIDKSNKPVALSKIYDSVLKDLNDYYGEMRTLFR